MNLDKSRKIMKEYKEYVFKATEFLEPIIERGEGSYVWDIDGNKYLDINSGQFCVVFGHTYKPFLDEINRQMEKIIHTNTMTLTSEVFEAAKELASINDGDLKKSIFLSTGAEANECAIRYAKFLTRKNKIISFSKGYHGLTLGTQSITMGGIWARPRIDGCIDIETPDLLYPSDNKNSDEFYKQCIEDLKLKINQNQDEIAAIIVEPILGTAGIVIPPQDYFKTLRKLCDDNNILLIFDECQTGFGRTGKWFCYQHFGIIPDILVTAKAIGMGLPVSAVTFRQSVIEEFEGSITHFSSHQNDPLAASIVKFVIQHIRDNDLLTQINEKGQYLINKLIEVSKENRLIVNPRGMGLMIGFELPLDLVKDDRHLTYELINRMQDNGVLLQAVRRGATFRILPNFLVTYEEIDYFIEMLRKSINQILAMIDHS